MMLALRAPVSVEFQLSSGEGLSVAQQCDLVAKLSPLINEWSLAGMEHFPLDGRGELLSVLEKGQRFYRLLLASVPAHGIELLDVLRGLKFFGSLVVDYRLEEDSSASQREADLREYIEQALAVGVEVNARVCLDEWACAHLEEIVVNATDLGVSRIVCERMVANGRDLVSTPLLRRAVDSVHRLQEDSYSVSLNATIPNCFSGLEEIGSLAGVVSAFIDECGDLYPCRGSRCKLGNLLNSDLESLWRSPALEAWRAALPAVCLECAHRELCPGGNMAFAGYGDGDPLIGDPLPSAVESLHEVVLEEDLCPRPMYVTREEEFGWVLMRANQVIPVSAKAGEVLALFDGNHNLADIERQFGAAALSFVYSLYVRGFVELVESQARE